jgi:hypothetical protein
MPPSPWLSARMTNVRYLTVTTRVSAHTMSEQTPSTSATSGCCPGCGAMPTCSVYRGLVPMSPKTTPSAPRARMPRFPDGA